MYSHKNTDDRVYTTGGISIFSRIHVIYRITVNVRPIGYVEYNMHYRPGMDIFVLQLNKRQSQQYGQCPSAGSNSKVPFVLHYQRDTSSSHWQCLNRGRPLPSAIGICIIVIFILMYTFWRFRTELRDKYRYFCDPIPLLLLRYFPFWPLLLFGYVLITRIANIILIPYIVLYRHV